MNKLTASVVLLGLTTMEGLTSAANLDKHRNKLAQLNAVTQKDLAQIEKANKEYMQVSTDDNVLTATLAPK